MKRKLLVLFLAIISALSLSMLIACGDAANNADPEQEDDGLMEITGITFSNYTCDYDGEEKIILISGELPKEVYVEYQNNSATNSGTYNATATLSGEGYRTKILHATLTINKLYYDTSSASWNYSSAFTYDGSEKTVSLIGLPEGISVSSYTNNKATNAGNYSATANLLYDTVNHFAPTIQSCEWVIDKATYDTSSASWNYSSAFTYDGSEKTVSLTGLPEGVSVSSYTNNKATNAGNYSATANLLYDTVNYFAPTIKACEWIINKADFVATMIDQSVYFDDTFHLPEFTGNLPSGTKVSYYINDILNTNGVCAIGKYAAKVVLSKANYNDLILNCVFKIKVNAAEIAAGIVNALGEVPDPWSFLPDSFAPSNHTLASAVSYDNFVNVSAIPVNGIGKQLNVVYDVLNKSTVALKYVNQIYKVFNAFQTAYTTFLDNDPDNYYKSFEYSNGTVSLSYQTVDQKYVVSASVSGISLTIFADADGSGYGAKINLTESTTLKYTVSENKLTVALNVLNSSATYVEFIRDNEGRVKGYLHEATDVVKELTLVSALIEVGEDYTTVVGTKGDFIVPAYGNNRNCEVYSNETGRLVGTEVRETLKPNSTVEYTTLWYNLYSVSGINSIKKIDETNGTNADTIYINGKTDTIHTKLVGGISAKTASRRFDIEFKKMYFYQLNSDGEYEKVDCEIPMLFIQEEQTSTFEADFADKNSVTVSLNVSTPVKEAVYNGFHVLVNQYDLIRDTISFDDIVAYCNA